MYEDARLRLIRREVVSYLLLCCDYPFYNTILEPNQFYDLVAFQDLKNDVSTVLWCRGALRKEFALITRKEMFVVNFIIFFYNTE